MRNNKKTAVQAAVPGDILVDAFQYAIHREHLIAGADFNITKDSRFLSLLATFKNKLAIQTGKINKILAATGIKERFEVYENRSEPNGLAIGYVGVKHALLEAKAGMRQSQKLVFAIKTPGYQRAQHWVSEEEAFQKIAVFYFQKIFEDIERQKKLMGPPKLDL
jgi:hypothetical protein